MTSAIFGVCSRSSCAKSTMIWRRLAWLVLRQVLKASLELATARSTSAGVAKGTRATTSWVAGSMTSRHSLVSDWTSSPPISSGTRGMSLIQTSRVDALKRKSMLDQTAGRGRQGLEGVLGRNRGHQFGQIPLALGLGGRLDFVQVHVVDHPAVGADGCIVHDRILDRNLAHLRRHDIALRGTRGRHGLQVMQHAGIHAGLRHGRLLALEGLGEAV